MHRTRIRPLYINIALAVFLLLAQGEQALGFPDGASHTSRFFSPPSLTHQVFQYVDWKYVEPGRSLPDNLLRGAFKHLETRYPEILIEMDDANSQVIVKVDEREKSFTLMTDIDHSKAAALIEKVLAFVEPLVQKDMDDKTLRYLTINGALRELDPHSNIFSRKHYKDFKVRTSGSFGGIGFTFGIHEGDLTIISPIPDTPASRAGLQSGDRIMFIDGEPTTNMGTDAAVGKMRGEPKTKVTLTIAREGWTKPRDFPIIREIIKIVSVEKFRLEGDDSPPVLYISVKNFQENTAEELRRAIKEGDSEEIRGLIIDLRNNPGGLLQQAIAVSDGFLEEGVIVSTRSRDREKIPRYAGRLDKSFSTKPVVVLINRGSASASEIVAGALQESRALVVGQKSFGKGSVQEAYHLMDGGGLLLTVSQYLTPGDISIQSIGIQPDIIVKPIVVDTGRLRLQPVKGHSSEAALKNAFTDWGNARREALARIEYLKAPPPESIDRFTAPTDEEKTDSLKKDFEVRLAREILGRVEKDETVGSRDSLVKAAEEVVSSLGDSEKKLIGEALADVGIVWDKGKQNSEDPPRLSVIFPEDMTLTAGSTARISLSVRNNGNSPAYRVWGGTQSANPILKNLDFAFGRIDPGEEKEWTAEIDIPDSIDDRWDPLTLELKTAGVNEVGSFSGGLFTRSRPLPHFAYSYTLQDENAEDKELNGDGILVEGERVRLILHVRNTGEVPSGKVEVNLHADEKENLYLDEVRQSIEGLNPGEDRKVPLSFRLLKAKDDGEVEIKITLTDQTHGQFFNDALKFTVGVPYPKNEPRFPPSFSMINPVPVRTMSKDIVLELEVTDDESVKEVYAYRGDKKIFYVRNRDGGASFPVKLQVSLDKGPNRVVVIARDQRNINSQRIFYIHRGEEGQGFTNTFALPAD